MTLKDDLDALYAKATPGEWQAVKAAPEDAGPAHSDPWDIIVTEPELTWPCEYVSEADARFMAAMHEVWPKLSAALDTLDQIRLVPETNPEAIGIPKHVLMANLAEHALRECGAS